MIKINLLGEDTKVDSSGVAFVAGYAGSVLILLIVCFVMHHAVASQIETSTAESEKLESTLAGLQKTTQEVRDLEAKKELLTSKLAVIARLKRNKFGPVRVLDDLNSAIPERAWIVGMREKSGILKIDGVALDNQTIAMFMTDLARSDYFTNIELGETKQADRKNVKVYEFTVQAKVNYSGKILAKDETGESAPQNEKASGAKKEEA